MWFKVAIFHAEQHTLLIQSLQQGILYTSTSLAVVLVVSCDLIALHSQPLFPVDRAVHKKKGAGYERPPDLSSAQGINAFSLS